MKKLVAFISSLSGFLILAAPSFAADPKLNLCDPTSQFGLLCSITTGNFGQILGQLITLIFVVSVIAALFYLVWGGFKWLTSGGDKTAVQTAREHIVAAIIGLVIIFLAYFILNVLVGFFTGKNVNDITIPTLTLCSQKHQHAACNGGKSCTQDTTTGDWCCSDTAGTCPQ